MKTGQLKNDLLVVDVLTGKEHDREHLPGKTLFSVEQGLVTEDISRRCIHRLSVCFSSGKQHTMKKRTR